jgi:hypothetical protein
MCSYYLDEKLLPNGFDYPKQYVDFIASEGTLEDPWSFFYGELPKFKNKTHLELCFTGLKKRYQDRDVVPFADFLCTDDIACFDLSQDKPKGAVIIIHDFASPGWEGREEFKDFNAWLAHAKQCAKDWKAEMGDNA